MVLDTRHADLACDEFASRCGTARPDVDHDDGVGVPRTVGMMSEQGSATVEYIGVVIALMLPFTYFVIAFSAVQSAQFGVVGAAQQAGRAFVQSRSESLASFAAVRAAAIAGRNHGLVLTEDQVSIRCDRSPCLQPGGTVSISIHTTVPVPYAAWLGRIPLHADTTVAVDAYRADPL